MEKMNSTEMLEKIESLATQGHKSLTINSTGKDGCKYSAHLIVMATSPINGSMSIFRDGQHFMDKSFKDVFPVYVHGMLDISGVLTGDRR
jgi:hypothetical protein